MVFRGWLLAAGLVLASAGCTQVGGQLDEGSLLRIAAAAESSRDFPLAARLYREAAAEAGDAASEAQALIGLGGALAQLGQYDDAIRAYKEALARDEEAVEAFNGLGQVHLAMNRPTLAEGEFARALETDPANRRALQGTAVAYDLAGRHGEAQRLYEVLLRQNPDDMTLRNNLGLSLALSGDTGRGVAVLEEVALDRRADARHRQNLAVAYGLAGRDDKARQLAKIDLGDEVAARNLEYLRLLRQIKAGTGERARGLQVNFARQTVALRQPEPTSVGAAATASARPESLPAQVGGGVQSAAAGPGTKRAVTAELARTPKPLSPTSSRAAVKEVALPALSGSGGFLAAGASPEASGASGSQPARLLPSGGRGAGVLVQLGAYGSEQLARRTWESHVRRTGDLLRDREKVIVPLDRAGRERLYRLRVADLPSRGAAASFCNQLKRRSIDCFVVAD